MTAYYNENDEYAAQWLRNLIAAGELPAGDVDTRSILDVQPEDLNGYDQCHFFAGIGVWPAALRRIGWPDNRPIWTGSCPCQPFSAAGKQLGVNDERHLWPAWFHLIAQRRPAIVVGEQVASALGWLDIVSNDLEAAHYAVGAADLCAPGFPVEGWHESPQHEWLLRAVRDCPDPVVREQLLDFAAWASGNLGAHDGDHIRQRLYFVGLADGATNGWPEERADSRGRGAGNGTQGWAAGFGAGGDAGRLADAESERLPRESLRTDGKPQERTSQSGEFIGLVDGEHAGLEGQPRHGDDWNEPRRHDAQPSRPVAPPSAAFGLADQPNAGLEGAERAQLQGGGKRFAIGSGALFGEADIPNGGARGAGRPTHALDSRRGAADWLYCRDGKWRPVEPRTFPLANAPAARVGRLRAYGNALDFETVVSFLRAVVGCLP